MAGQLGRRPGFHEGRSFDDGRKGRKGGSSSNARVSKKAGGVRRPWREAACHRVLQGLLLKFSTGSRTVSDGGSRYHGLGKATAHSDLPWSQKAFLSGILDIQDRRNSLRDRHAAVCGMLLATMWLNGCTATWATVVNLKADG